MDLMTGVAAFGAAVGGVWLWRRLDRWEPKGDRLGDGVARTGIDASKKVSSFAEESVPVVGGAVSDVMRVSGELTSKTVGSSVNAVDDLAMRVVPGRHEEKPPAKKAATKPESKTAKKAASARSTT